MVFVEAQIVVEDFSGMKVELLVKSECVENVPYLLNIDSTFFIQRFYKLLLFVEVEFVPTFEIVLCALSEYLV